MALFFSPRQIGDVLRSALVFAAFTGVVVAGASGQAIKHGARAAKAPITKFKADAADTPARPASTLTGVISDTMCRASKHDPSKDAAECVRHCAKTGSKYSLVSDGKVYTLHGDAAEFSKLAGQKVSVSGTVNAYDVTVSTVSPVEKP